MAEVHSENDAISRLLDERLVELQALFETSQLLNSSLNLHTILDNVLRTCMGKMMVSKGIALVQDQGDLLTVTTLKGMDRALIGKKLTVEPFPDTAIEIKNLGLKIYPWADYLATLGIEWVVPIIGNNKKLGLIGFSQKITGRAFSSNELDFLNSLSNIAATAIENGLIFHELNRVNNELDKKIQELGTLFDISKELNSTLDEKKVTNLLSFAIMGELVVQRCLIFTRENDRMTLVVRKGIGYQDEEDTFLSNPQFLSELCQLSEPYKIDDPDAPAFLKKFNCCQIKVVAPMSIQGETRGILALGEKYNKADFRQDELNFLYTLGNQAIISLENARLFRETLEKQRMEEELAIAAQIQKRLLPKELPKVENFEIAGINIPSRQVGGDYFDCIQIDKDRLGICIADVSGKGVPASLLMSNLQAGIRALLQPNTDIATMVGRINNIIYQNTDMDKFITFFYGELNIKSGKFTFSNAGHNPPYWAKADGTLVPLEAGGLLLGMIPNIPYLTGQIELKPGDRILLFTDGVTEAMDPDENEFTEAGVEQVLHNTRGSGAQELLTAVSAAVKEFIRGAPQSDDFTMVAIKAR